MTLNNPVVVYEATSHEEANFLCEALRQAGVEAHLGGDVARTGVWGGGLVPQTHEPQVYVAEADAEKARGVIIAHLNAVEQQSRAATSASPVTVTCDECHQQATFEGDQAGTVQQCPHCGAYLDVGEVVGEGWEESEATDGEPKDDE